MGEQERALARYILDDRFIVRRRTITDLAAGSGLVGIAAAIAGAEAVTTADIDEFARAAMKLNSTLQRSLHRGHWG